MESNEVNYDLTITSEKLIEELGKLNIHGENKTFTLKFPDKFESEECAHMFLRGVLDGDGNINEWCSITILTASENFISGLIKFINSELDINYELKWRKIGDKSYPYVYIKSEESRKLCEKMYNGYEDFRIEYKYYGYHSYKNSLSNIKIAKRD